jgi:hypothetical protein
LKVRGRMGEKVKGRLGEREKSRKKFVGEKVL